MAAESVVQERKPMSFDTHVAEVIRRTHDTKSFRFPRPFGFDFLPGQWMYVNIMVDGTNKLHHFTISSSPTEPFLEFTKKITDHPYSKALDTMKAGDWAHINGPFGDFTFSGEQKKIAGLTGGIGITPLHSIIRYIADKKLPADVKLLYSNKTSGDIVFKSEFYQLAHEHRNIDIRYVVTREQGWTGLSGHIDAGMVRQQIPDFKERVFYICGPPAMNASLKKALKELDMPDDRIKVEDFPGY